jgi:pilus assembly protein CpaC
MAFRYRKIRLLGLLASALFVLSAMPVRAQMAVPMEILLGKSQIITLKEPIKKITVASSEIADVDLVTPTQFVVFGNSLGATNLIVIDEAGKTSFFDVTIRPPIEDYQVLLKVKVAEVNRTAAKDLGINFATINHSSSVNFGGAGYSGQASPPALSTSGNLNAIRGIPGVSLADSISAAIFRFTPNNDAAAVFKALSDKGLLTTLAEPNMVVRSGENGEFHVGGEIPIPITTATSGGGSAISVTFKSFGISINISPVIYEDGRISLKIDPAEASELDYANAVTLGGFSIPALKTREVSTSVDLREDETLILAGLISHQDSRTVSKFPLLGDIPILGALFRSTSFQKNKSDLMIFITPKLVQPSAPGTEVAYPGKGGPDSEELKQYRWIPLLPPAVNKPE